MSVATWAWHLPAVFELTLRSPMWHLAEHASFLVPYLLLADVQNTALAALFVFSDRVLYPSYAHGGNPLDDQAAAGVLMWVPMSLAYLIPPAVLTVRFLAPRPLTPRSSVPSRRSPAMVTGRAS
jgi:cytochrome c oxidase assembly factor CtaG